MSRVVHLRNYRPEHGIVVPVEHHRGVIRALLETTPLHPAGVSLLVEKLLECDLRCVYSHGSRLLPRYVKVLSEGAVNGEPRVRAIADFGATAVVDGDGGMGHEACAHGMELVLEKTAQLGMGACTTRNHYHTGAAGTWTRMAAERGFVGMAMASSRRTLNPGKMVMGVVKPSPMSFAFPSGQQPPLVLDMGSRLAETQPALMEQYPRLFFKALGISASVQALGGILAGIERPESESQTTGTPWQSTQGAFLCAWDVSRFMPREEFAAEMDRFVREVRRLTPFPGTDRAELPGGMEWQWEKENREHGIPLGDEHRNEIEALGARVAVECGYDAFDETRF